LPGLTLRAAQRMSGQRFVIDLQSKNLKTKIMTNTKVEEVLAATEKAAAMWAASVAWTEAKAAAAETAAAEAWAIAGDARVSLAAAIKAAEKASAKAGVWERAAKAEARECKAAAEKAALAIAEARAAN